MIIIDIYKRRSERIERNKKRKAVRECAREMYDLTYIHRRRRHESFFCTYRPTRQILILTKILLPKYISIFHHHLNGAIMQSIESHHRVRVVVLNRCRVPRKIRRYRFRKVPHVCVLVRSSNHIRKLLRRQRVNT